jgi:hypothetical protein
LRSQHIERQLEQVAEVYNRDGSQNSVISLF